MSSVDKPAVSRIIPAFRMCGSCIAGCTSRSRSRLRPVQQVLSSSNTKRSCGKPGLFTGEGSRHPTSRNGSMKFSGTRMSCEQIANSNRAGPPRSGFAILKGGGPGLLRSQFVNTQIVFENRKNNCEINYFLTFPDLRAKNRPNEGARALWSEMRGVVPLTFLSKRGGPGFMRKFMPW